MQPWPKRSSRIRPPFSDRGNAAEWHLTPDFSTAYGTVRSQPLNNPAPYRTLQSPCRFLDHARTPTHRWLARPVHLSRARSPRRSALWPPRSAPLVNCRLGIAAPGRYHSAHGHDPVPSPASPAHRQAHRRMGQSKTRSPRPRSSNRRCRWHAARASRTLSSRTRSVGVVAGRGRPYDHRPSQTHQTSARIEPNPDVRRGCTR